MKLKITFLSLLSLLLLGIGYATPPIEPSGPHEYGISINEAQPAFVDLVTTTAESEATTIASTVTLEALHYSKASPNAVMAVMKSKHKVKSPAEFWHLRLRLGVKRTFIGTIPVRYLSNPSTAPVISQLERPPLSA